MIDATEKRHFYGFSFFGRMIGDTSQRAYANANLSFSVSNKISLKDIYEAKKTAGVMPDATLLGVSYLGYMDSKEWNDDALFLD